MECEMGSTRSTQGRDTKLKKVLLDKSEGDSFNTVRQKGGK
jgi:hypothetical protein